MAQEIPTLHFLLSLPRSIGWVDPKVLDSSPDKEGPMHGKAQVYLFENLGPIGLTIKISNQQTFVGKKLLSTITVGSIR
tara:strand:- start:507 stop:743 length:237 start_codon:yes stop_codon:yes gene_type:complete